MANTANVTGKPAANGETIVLKQLQRIIPDAPEFDAAG
jgi:hypothetical protein